MKIFAQFYINVPLILRSTFDKMTYNLSYHLLGIIPGIRGIVRHNQCSHTLKNLIVSRQFCLDFATAYGGDKYSKLRNRLDAIPYVKLLNEEVDRVHQELCFDEDKRLEDVLNRCSKVFNYNARHGKMGRGITLLKAYCTYGFSIDDAAWNQWDSDKWKSAILLAWCVELVQAYILILDDITDQSLFRRGKPCWYTKPDVGLGAVNDALLLQSGIFKLLQKHLAGSDCYMRVLHEFLQSNEKIFYGQCIDMEFNSRHGEVRFDKFTLEKYQTLTEYKTAHYSVCQPVHLAMHLAGGYSAKDYDFTKKLCLMLGSYFQCQDDLLDCFGKPELTGKFGNDIREGKCTWFSVKFLEVASEPMKKQFLKNYGVDDQEAIAKVLELYKEANLLERFEEFDEQLCAELTTLIESMNDTRGGLFYNLFAQFHKRQK